jgi:hypothetical protein
MTASMRSLPRSATGATSATPSGFAPSPTPSPLRRLATLADTATLTDEADTLDETAVPARLAAALLVLADRIDDATILPQRTEPLGWSRGDHPGPLVLPILLLAAAGNDPRSIARLHGANALLVTVDQPGWHDMRHLLDRDNDDEEPIPGEQGAFGHTNPRIGHTDGLEWTYECGRRTGA